MSGFVKSSRQTHRRGMRYWMLAPMQGVLGSINWTACLRAGEFPNCLTGTDANARDTRGLNARMRQCYAFSLFDIEFIVNAN